MTTLTLRYRKGYFVVSGPDTQPDPVQVAPRSERLVPYTASLGRPSMRSAPRTNMTDDQRRSVYIITIAGVLVIAAVQVVSVGT
jgi:hypothetical protein